MPPIFRTQQAGFTLIELMIVIATVGILTAVSIPNFISYRQRAENAVLETNLHTLMDLQEFYYLENDSFFPRNGMIYVPNGTGVEIPELGFTFRDGHKHRFMLYSFRFTIGSYQYDYFYLMVYADYDFNRNGYNDIYYYLTYVRDYEFLYNRYKIQIR